MLAVDDTRIYWPENTTSVQMSVWSAPLAGGSPVELWAMATNSDSIAALLVDATHVYWAAGQGIWALPK